MGLCAAISWKMRLSMIGHPFGNIIALKSNLLPPNSDKTWGDHDSIVKLACGHFTPTEVATKIIPRHHEATQKIEIQCVHEGCYKPTNANQWKTYSKLLPTGQGLPKFITDQCSRNREFVYFAGPKVGLLIKLSKAAIKGLQLVSRPHVAT